MVHLLEALLAKWDLYFYINDMPSKGARVLAWEVKLGAWHQTVATVGVVSF